MVWITASNTLNENAAGANQNEKMMTTAANIASTLTKTIAPSICPRTIKAVSIEPLPKRIAGTLYLHCAYRMPGPIDVRILTSAPDVAGRIKK
jgi:hypothetical protein